MILLIHTISFFYNATVSVYSTRNFSTKNFIEVGIHVPEVQWRYFDFFITSWIAKSAYLTELHHNTYNMYIIFNIRETSSIHDDENIISNKSICESPISLDFKKTFRVD